MRKMFWNLVRFLCKLLGVAYVAEQARRKLGFFICEFQHTIREKAKKIGGVLLLIGLIFMLLNLGLRFLLFGLASWLNTLLSSTYLGFFIVSIFCFLVVGLIVLKFYVKMDKQ